MLKWRRIWTTTQAPSVGLISTIRLTLPGQARYPSRLTVQANPTGGNWAINALWLATSAGNGSGVDNLCVGTAGECVAFEPPPPATAFEWTSADSGDWNTGGNWNPLNGTAGSRPPGNQSALQSSEHTATFGDAIGSASRTVFTDTAVTVNSISFHQHDGRELQNCRWP